MASPRATPYFHALNMEPRRGPRQQTLDKDDARRNREETTISLRKDKRAQQLQKKRFGVTGNQAAATTVMAPNAGFQAPSVGSQAWQEANPPALVEGVHSDDPNLQLPAVTQFRKLLSIERSPPHRGGDRGRGGSAVRAVPAVRRQPDAAV